jgi:hypothetical protein
MPYELISGISWCGGAWAWKCLAAYCVQDTILPKLLLKKWTTLADQHAQARIYNLPVATNVFCGQQQRVEANLLLRTYQRGGGKPPMVMNGVDLPRAYEGRNWLPAASLLPVGGACGGYLNGTRIDTYVGTHNCLRSRLSYHLGGNGARGGGGGVYGTDPSWMRWNGGGTFGSKRGGGGGGTTTAGCQKTSTFWRAGGGSTAGVSDYDDFDEEDDEEEVATGGLVLANKAGLHMVPVCVIDFNSLYPSIQQALNLCWSSVIHPIDPNVDPLGMAALLVAMDHGLIVRMFFTETGTFMFAQNIQAVFPQLLKDMLAVRNYYKERMKAAKSRMMAAKARDDMDAYAVASAEYASDNVSQLATKTLMNAGYGMANCTKGKAPCKAMGTTTCWEGRMMNSEANALCSSHFTDMDTLYGDTDSIFVTFKEPADVLALSKKQRALLAWAKGLMAEALVNDHFKAKFNNDIVKTELEKLYFPWLSANRKQYAGPEWTFDDLQIATDDLGPPSVTGLSVGAIKHKGTRIVRLDVAAFVRSFGEDLCHILMYDGNMDTVFDFIHKEVEDCCHRRARYSDPRAFVQTNEVKYSINASAVPAHLAVSFAREYRRRGSAFPDGTRIPLVFVEEADVVRVNRPPWLRLDGTCDAVPEEDAEAQRLAAIQHFTRLAFRRADVELKCAMHARHIDEVLEAPSENTIDVVRYVDLGICSVVNQLIANSAGEQALCVQYAMRVQKRYAAQREARKAIAAHEARQAKRAAEAAAAASAPSSVLQQTPTPAAREIGASYPGFTLDFDDDEEEDVAYDVIPEMTRRNAEENVEEAVEKLLHRRTIYDDDLMVSKYAHEHGAHCLYVFLHDTELRLIVVCCTLLYHGVRSVVESVKMMNHRL